MDYSQFCCKIHSIKILTALTKVRAELSYKIAKILSLNICTDENLGAMRVSLASVTHTVYCSYPKTVWYLMCSQSK